VSNYTNRHKDKAREATVDSDVISRAGPEVLFCGVAVLGLLVFFY
jgi:hypothetical protein